MVILGQNNEKDKDVFRIYEHKILKENGVQNVKFTRKVKVTVKGLRDKHKNFEGIHSVAATKNQEFIILIDQKNACVIDFRNAEIVEKGSEKVITLNDQTKIYMHDNKFIKGI